MFSFRSLTPVFIHQATIALAVLGGMFFLSEPLCLLGLLLMPQAPILPDETASEEGTEAVGHPMGFITDED